MGINPLLVNNYPSILCTMRLLLFSDLHCDVRAARDLVERSRCVDVVIGAGDFATARNGIEQTIDILQAISCPSILVPGNNETDQELIKACEHWTHSHVLHGTGVDIDGVSFFGIGSGVPVTPFGSWSFDLTEVQAKRLLERCPKGCVLICHSPPRGAVDQSSDGKHLGSEAIRETVEAKHPQLVVCGHIHNHAGEITRIGESPVVNAGPMGIEWSLEP